MTTNVSRYFYYSEQLNETKEVEKSDDPLACVASAQVKVLSPSQTKSTCDTLVTHPLDYARSIRIRKLQGSDEKIAEIGSLVGIGSS